MNKAKWIAGLMAMTLTFSMTACKSSGGTEETTHVPETDGETQETQITPETTGTVPQETLDLFYPEELKEMKAIRVEERFRANLENLIANTPAADGVEGSIPVFSFQDREALAEFLSQYPSEKISGLSEEYNDAFFGDYDLVLIPRVSNSGSVKYTTEILQENGRIVVEVAAEVPEIGTADMASWFLMVPVPKDMVKTGVPVVARMAGGIGTGFGSGFVLPTNPPAGTVNR